MHKTDMKQRFHCRQLLWKTPLSYLIPASRPPLRVRTPEQERQNQTAAYRAGKQNMQPCSPFSRSQHLKSVSLHSHVQTSPLPLPDGIHAGKFPLRQKQRRRSALEIAPFPPLRRSVGVNHVSRLWGPQVQGLNAHWLCLDRETAICLYSPYPPFTTLLWLSLDSQEFLLLYLLRDWPACGKNAFCGP